MKHPKAIEIEAFDYNLPEENIAKYPVKDRHLSKLLIRYNDSIQEDIFFNIDQYLSEDSILFFNNTKVFQARFYFEKSSGSVIEIFCLEPLSGISLQQAFQSTQSVEWLVYIGNNKRWKEASLEKKITYQDSEITLKVQKKQALNEAWHVQFSWDMPVSFETILMLAAQIPLPPYLNRKPELDDKDHYQTLYAKEMGSVAAPTAGLHFTPEVFEKLKAKGIYTDFFTLHVGAGTFKPVSSKVIGEHSMHWEKISFSKGNIENLLRFSDNKIIAVGTTTVRALESLYWHGLKWIQNKSELRTIEVNQWEPYSKEYSLLPVKEVVERLLEGMKEQGISEIRGITQIMIVPGYQFRIIKGIITNFHQPKSTLLLLVSAFLGDDWKDLYAYALAHQFRFLSYGDACLFL